MSKRLKPKWCDLQEMKSQKGRKFDKICRSTYAYVWKAEKKE